jgi:hypothetical protein
VEIPWSNWRQITPITSNCCGIIESCDNAE